MRRNRLRELNAYLSRNQHRRAWRSVVGVLACLVVFCTTYALILPAITMEKTTNCEEHTHTESCYGEAVPVEKTVPVCTLESLGIHRHTEGCLDEGGKYICGYSDFVIHQHDGSCYDENGDLWCPLPEVEAHIHGEGCYTQPETQLEAQLEMQPGTQLEPRPDPQPKP